VSNIEPAAVVEVAGAASGEAAPDEGGTHFELVPGRPVLLTARQRVVPDGQTPAEPMTVVRYLPTRGRRMVGAWCFVDYYGPDDIGASGGMQIPPHPHCGLQTVSWLLRGQIRHRDSLGSDAVVQPGQLSLMTAGAGIAHAETSPDERDPVLHGAQLWVALPTSALQGAPAFDHHEVLPTWTSGGVTATVILGTLAGVSSPATAYSPLVGAELQVPRTAAAEVAVEVGWEYAVLALEGAVVIDGRTLDRGDFAYLGRGRSRLAVAAADGAAIAHAADTAATDVVGRPARALLLGGEPFAEQIVMWWNFVGRSHDDIAEARRAWMSNERFGAVERYPGDRLPAPPLPPVRLTARGRS
jgi:redox-sensitive bicupin YhaK (pirin superfamily)